MPSYEQSQREMIQESLDAAWDDHKAGNADAAFQHLIRSIERLANLQRHLEKSINSAVNTASCLANGIQPD